MNTTHFYRLKRPDLPWGDYGDMLAHGMASHREGVLELERTGPYVPPLFQPSDHVVITDAFLPKLQESGLTGFDVCPVVKKKITKVEWREWEPYGTEEMKYPAGNEPENYIARRKHSQPVSDEIGDLWWIRFQPGIRLTRANGYRLLGATWSGTDFFVVDGERATHSYVSQKARDWLSETVPEWVAFQEERVTWDETP
jgi:hypothetical protein